MQIRIRRFDIHRIDLRTRMPFRYGIATMTEVPEVFVRLWVEIDGKEWTGVASDCLPPKWFTKIPGKPLAAEIDEMLRVIQNALALAVDLRGSSAFEVWQQLYEAQAAWAKREQLPPLLGHFGTSLVERALLEALCRASGRTFAQMLRGNLLGITLETIHSSLKGCSPPDFLPSEPLQTIVARHTVGLADPLTDEDIAPEERLHDGLPQSLTACIEANGLRHFKIKVEGDLTRDIDRLLRLAVVLQAQAHPQFAFSLDGNEQFKSLAQFQGYWETISAEPKLKEFLRHLLFVEQPVHRDFALQPEAGEALGKWPQRPPIIIDESDATLEDLPTALRLGYAGTSHKNCKGVFKGVANRCLLEHLRQTKPQGHPLMSGEDLCNIGPVALLQDLAVMAALGIRSVERNGHHYHAGLSQFPENVQKQVLAHHPDLYAASAGGWPALKITNGEINLQSINEAPFGVGFGLGMEQFTRVH